MTSKPVKSELSDSSIVVAAAEQISSDIGGGEAVILNLKSGVYHGLNEVGARIWDLIQKPKVVKDVEQILLEEYDVESEVCINDLLGLLNQLRTVGLIEVKNEKVT